MKINQQIKIKQNQSIVMTPQLQQAIKLLQLTNIELAEYVENAKLENPFIKEDLNIKKLVTNDEKTFDVVENAKQNKDPLKVNSDLEMNNSFDTHISEKTFEQNKNTIKNNFESKSTSLSEVIENTVSNKISLKEYLTNQIRLSFEKKDQSFAISLIDYLHPSGWLVHPVEEIAEELNRPVNYINEIIKNLQSLEPIGIFARSLSECLKIQLQEKGILNNEYQILIDNLTLITKGKIKTLIKMCEIENNKIIHMLNIIKTLNPKPAENYNNEPLRISEPDIIVTKTNKGWKIDLNKSTLPTIKLDEDYITEISNLNLGEDDNNFTTNKIGEAKWLQKAVDQRNKTILKVSSVILQKQMGFFKHGFSHMKPLILKDVADAIGMHESTVSRVTNSKLILTEWGLFSLKEFFSASIPSSEESDKHAASAVREALKKLISSEVSNKPLSDEKIADVLSDQGIDVARRTVAKYRDMLNIPSSAERKRRSKFNKLLSVG
ncbi:RNA polymerase factor sigma-54 [Alphaproteobacteria bacterium]|nr:RNA polymerase factor sigma-54 [Alphaproteobacteria bacterium]